MKCQLSPLPLPLWVRRRRWLTFQIILEVASKGGHPIQTQNRVSWMLSYKLQTKTFDCFVSIAVSGCTSIFFTCLGNTILPLPQGGRWTYTVLVTIICLNIGGLISPQKCFNTILPLQIWPENTHNGPLPYSALQSSFCYK